MVVVEEQEGNWRLFCFLPVFEHRRTFPRWPTDPGQRRCLCNCTLGSSRRPQRLMLGAHRDQACQNIEALILLPIALALIHQASLLSQEDTFWNNR